MNFGTFLLMQSPSARPSQEIYARAVEQAQAAERLGFRNIWLAEHHFSTYGYLSRPLQLATYIAAKTTPHPGGHRGHRGAAPPSAGGRRGDRHARRCSRRRAARHRPRARLPALRVRALRPRARERARPLGRVGRHHPEGVRGQAVQLRGQALQDPRDHDLPAADAEAAAADLDHRAEPRTRSRRRCAAASTCSPAASACRSSAWPSSASSSTSVVAEVKPPQPLARRRAARGLRDERATPTRATPPRRRAGTCA